MISPPTLWLKQISDDEDYRLKCKLKKKAVSDPTMGFLSFPLNNQAFSLRFIG
jgi:hypothetical protein